MNAEAVFEKAGFVDEYRSELELFYNPYFKNESALYDFFQEVFKIDSLDNRPRYLMNDTFNFVRLANDIEKIRPGRDPLRVFFFHVCMESLRKDSGIKESEFSSIFENCFSVAGKQYILSNFVFTGIAIPLELTGIDRLKFETHANYKLTFLDFINVIKATRNLLAHSGDYWSMQFFARDTDSIWLTNMTTDDDVISCCKRQRNKKLTYCFCTTMQYEQFEFYFVEACVAYIKQYMAGKTR